VFHFLKASVVDVGGIWGKGDRFTGEIGEWTKCGNCKGNLTDLRRILHLSLAKGNPK
jgi:hypothetical protein